VVLQKKQDLKLYERLTTLIEEKQFAVFFDDHFKSTFPIPGVSSSNDPSHLVKDYLESHLPSISAILVSLNLPHLLQGTEWVDYLPFESFGPKRLFEDHLPHDEAFVKVKSGDLFEGVFHVLRDDQSKAWVSIQKGVPRELQVAILPQHNNRAIDGDIVVVQMSSDMEIESTLETDEGVDVIITSKQSQKPLPTIEGKIVHIFKRRPKQYCGSIKRTGFNTLGKELCVFTPVNPKIPEVSLFLEYGEKLINQRILIEIDDWNAFSERPRGHMIRIIGDLSRIETESEVILLEHDVIIKPFTQAALGCLPPKEWTIPQEELASRLDLRDRVVASVDPPGCKDIDDALHCALLPNGNYEIGVHIADVTYFVKANSALDLEASERCTTVYLVEKRTDMLPGILTEVLCSLVHSQDRLAFSVIWEMTSEFQVVRTCYAKSIIHSRASLSYQAASQIINSDAQDELALSLRRLLKISKVLRERRILNGALELASTEVKFELDPERQGKNIALYKTYETNSMVEEFMLLANVSVGEKIVNSYPAYSILRRHPSPKLEDLGKLSSKLKKLGFSLDYSSSKDLASSLNKIRNSDPYFNTLVRMQVTRCMNQAVYFCSSEFDRLEYRHYGLAAEIYTHFTSPIRRYADVLVHRLLSAAIDIESLPDSMTDRRIMGKICKRMNLRNRMSQFAERTSANLHTYLVFKNKGSSEEDAVVTEVLEFGVNVLVPSIGLEGSIQLKGCHSQDFIEWVCENGKKVKVYSHLKVRISISFVNFRKTIDLELVDY
jgi:exosome complex exonuclease DIS3/RRP44